MAGGSGGPAHLSQLLRAELLLEESQWEQRPGHSAEHPVQCWEVDSLVHDGWLAAVKSGHVTGPQVPPIPQEELHWLLQPSCESVLPQPWQRVHLLCVCKPHPSLTCSSRRALVPQFNHFSEDSIHDFLTQIAQENRLLSWKEIMSVLQGSPKHLSSRPPITGSFVHELVWKLYHIPVHHIGSGGKEEKEDGEGTSTTNHTPSPSKHHNTLKTSRLRPTNEPLKEKTSEDDVHPNLSPLIAALESRHAFYFVFPYLRFTLFDSAMHSPAMLEDSIAKPLFVLYQLLQLLNHCHGKGATLGDLGLKNIFIDARLWVQVRLPWDVYRAPPSKATPLHNKFTDDKSPATSSHGAVNQMEVTGERSEVTDDTEEEEEDGGSHHLTPSPSPVGSSHPSRAGSTNTLTGPGEEPAPADLSYPPLSLHLCEATYKWRTGELSNFDYLMLLNQHAGRVLGDPNNHPIFPWVMEFTHKDGGYRDLTKSKYRLNKGDRQLDFTFLSAQEELRRGQDHEALVPHHIGDISSDVTYYVYLARRTPKEVLCSRVRPQWVPKEYPSSIEKLYTWTPDECIPEFYADPSVFKSVHSDLSDLGVPDWASSPEELVSVHRAALEGDVVSANLHHWIDLMFGYKLTGHDAIKAKNVYVSLVDRHKDPKNCGIVQLFKSSHPKRVQSSSAPHAIFSWNTYLSMSSMMNATSFPIHQPSSSHHSSSRHKAASAAGGTHNRYTSPEPDNQKTLESIIIEQAVSQQNGPSVHEDGVAGDVGQDSLEDDFTSSFEHVNMEEVKGHRHMGSASPVMPSADFGIHYEEALPSNELKAPPPLSKPRGESVVMPLPTNRFRVPVVNMIFNRQRHKGTPGDADIGYDWQQEEVSFPKEASILHRLNKLEDMAHFAFKSCKDDGGLYQEQWEPQDLVAFDSTSSSRFHPLLKVLECVERSPSYYPSFDERVALDVAAVTCTIIELCCVKQLRAAMPTDPSLLQRISTIRKLMRTGQLRLPSYLSYLVDLVLAPEQPGRPPTSPSELKLPSLTSSILLQSFLPVVMFPTYFQQFYKFSFHLEQLCHQQGVDYVTMDLQRLTHMGLQLKREAEHRNFDEVFAFISERLENLLEVVTEEGFPLLLMHLFPFFQYPDTSFDAVYAFLPALAKHMSKWSVHKVFTAVVTRLFDTAVEPHQRGQLFSRTTADLILRRFGLSTFLNRFLGFLIEAVVEPLRVSSKSHSNKRINANIVRMRSQSVLTLMTSDLLQSQVYPRSEAEGPDLSSSISYSLAMNEPSYDSDKEYSSSDSGDDMDSGESSLLAKSSVLSAEGEADGGMTHSPAGGVAHNPAVGVAHSPLVMTSQASSVEPGSVEALASGYGAQPTEGGVAGGVANGSQEESGYSVPGTVPPPLLPSLLEQNKEQMLAVNSYQESLTVSSHFDPTQSIGSQLSEDSFASDVNFTSSLQATPYHMTNGEHKNQLGKQLSLSIGMKLGLGLPLSSTITGEESDTIPDEEQEGDGGDTDTLDGGDSVSSCDPQTIAVNLNVSGMAADCLAWLVRRLGPLLASQHIISPLIDNLHRCFSGILNLKGREVAALRCLTSFAECYGETVVKKMYVPHAESMVAFATNRMTTKSEAGVAASLGIIRVSIKSLSPATLIDCAQEICDRYFLLLIQLLSSQTTFPSGGKARAAICQSMVKLLVLLGEGLGREQACDLLRPTLQCFFASFSSVHQDDGREKATPTTTADSDVAEPLSPSPKHASHPEAKPVEFHPLTESLDDPKSGDDPKSSDTPSYMPDSEVYRQLCTTFSKAMAHTAYVNFCMLLGQYYLHDCLCNADLIEQIAYSHDEMEHPQSPLTSILTETLSCDSDTNSESESDEESDDDMGMARDAALKVGPIAAVTGLGMEEAGFRKSSWFVDLEGVEKDDAGGREPQGQSSPIKTVNKSSSIDKDVAMFDAKFSGVGQQSEAAPVHPAAGRGLGIGMTPSSAASPTQQDFTLAGAWEELWESHLHEPVYQRDGFHHFRGRKLQTYTGPNGHKGAVKCLALSDGEHFFVSGSKDKTVKIWSLRNQGKGSNSVGCQLTYTGHQKLVTAVELLERIDTVASCDGTLQLWDPETGYLLHQFTSPRSSSFSTIKPLPSSQAVLVAATADMHLRFIDTRMKTLLHLWKMQFPTGGIIRALACADNWVSVGNHNGAINTLDVRTGELLSLWKPADSATVQSTTWNENLLQMKPTCRGNLVTSVGSGLISLWRPTHGKLIYHLKGQSNSTNCLEVVGEQLISAATNGNIVIHTSFESSRDCHHVSQRTSKKPISALATLRENKLLLLGQENGHIVLMA